MPKMAVFKNQAYVFCKILFKPGSKHMGTMFKHTEWETAFSLYQKIIQTKIAEQPLMRKTALTGNQ